MTHHDVHRCRCMPTWPTPFATAIFPQFTFWCNYVSGPTAYLAVNATVERTSYADIDFCGPLCVRAVRGMMKPASCGKAKG